MNTETSEEAVVGIQVRRDGGLVPLGWQGRARIPDAFPYTPYQPTGYGV